MAYRPNDGGSNAPLTPEAIQQLLASLGNQGGTNPQAAALASAYAPQPSNSYNLDPSNFSGAGLNGGNSSATNPFAQLFSGGDLGGGPSSPDLAAMQRRSGVKSGWENVPADSFIGPTAPDMGGTETPDDGNLAAINALMELAGNMPQPGEGGIDIAGIMKSAAGAARKPFQAQIQSTKNQNQRAKADTEYGSNQIRKMYRALSKSNRKAAGRESDQTLAAAESMQQMSQQSADELSADNQARLDSSAAQSAALGSGDLATTLGAEINANTSEGARQLAETATNASMATANRGEAERRYLNRSASNANLTGTNRAADLFGDLQDYLQGNRDKIGELRGQSAAAAGAARQSAAASAASSQSDLYSQQYGAHQDLLSNQMALLGMKQGLQQQDFDNNMSMEELAMRMQESSQQEAPMIPGFPDGLVESLPDDQRSALMMQQYLTPESGGMLSQLMQNPALRSGFYTNEGGDNIPIGGNALNSEQLMAQLGLSSKDPQQNLILSNIIAALASGNTDLPFGAQRG